MQQNITEFLGNLSPNNTCVYRCTKMGGNGRGKQQSEEQIASKIVQLKYSLIHNSVDTHLDFPGAFVNEFKQEPTGKRLSILNE